MPRERNFLPLQSLSRQRKYSLFMEKLKPRSNDLILDLGGSDGSYLVSYYPWPGNITLMDIEIPRLSKSSSTKKICGNALTLPFDNNSFDIVWCNALIEHVGDFRYQRILANEIQRVGKSFFVTTPWKGFPIELHYQLPLYQFVPKRIQKLISRNFSVGWYKKGEWEDIYLLWLHQMKTLFPKATVIKHRVSFWPETLIAYLSLKL